MQMFIRTLGKIRAASPAYTDLSQFEGAPQLPRFSWQVAQLKLFVQRKLFLGILCACFS